MKYALHIVTESGVGDTLVEYDSDKEKIAIGQDELGTITLSLRQYGKIAEFMTKTLEQLATETIE